MQKCHIIDTDDCDEEVISTSAESNNNDYMEIDLSPNEIKEESVIDLPASKRRSSSRKSLPSVKPESTTDNNANTEATKNVPYVADKKAARRVPYPLAIDNGGWQGWHCEGSIFKTLFGLFMWEVLFACPMCSNGGSNATSQCNSTYCVFITPFQDAPLDLGHRSFYRTRRVAIQKRIAQIASFSTPQLIAELGVVYIASTTVKTAEGCTGA